MLNHRQSVKKLSVDHKKIVKMTNLVHFWVLMVPYHQTGTIDCYLVYLGAALDLALVYPDFLVDLTMFYPLELVVNVALNGVYKPKKNIFKFKKINIKSVQ